MLSTGEQAADFLKVFHPILKASGQNISIACCDGEGWEGSRSQLAGLQEAGAEDAIEIVTSHGYTAPQESLSTQRDECVSSLTEPTPF